MIDLVRMGEDLFAPLRPGLFAEMTIVAVVFAADGGIDLVVEVSEAAWVHYPSVATEVTLTDRHLPAAYRWWS